MIVKCKRIFLELNVSKFEKKIKNLSPCVHIRPPKNGTLGRSRALDVKEM